MQSNRQLHDIKYYRAPFAFVDLNQTFVELPDKNLIARISLSGNRKIYQYENQIHIAVKKKGF
jgi:hypothetical protein